MKDTKTGDLLDLDFDVEALPDGMLEVVDVRIHKVNGAARYTYDDQDNRIPLARYVALNKAGAESRFGRRSARA